MIVASTFGRCCMAYLLLVTHTFFTVSSSPIRNVNVNGKGKRMCGSDFSNTVKSVCLVLKPRWRTSQNPSPSAAHVSKENDQNVQGGSGKTEYRGYYKCCYIGCSRKELEEYCEVVRNQTTVLVQNSQQEVSSAIVTELISQTTELIPQTTELVTTTETPSDSTPEYILNESLEQEAFTILSTYRTPQYSINSLQFL